MAGRRILQQGPAGFTVNINVVHAFDPSVVLIFGPFDPTGASSLPADAVTFAGLGCHALGALTATLVRDSAGTEDIQPASPEFLNDQARCLLEDMAVKAIKVGPVYTTETVSVIAQIAADYSDVPLVLQPAALSYESLAEDIDAEDTQLALFELLLPQTDIVVTHHNLLNYWAGQGLLGDATPENPAQGMLDHGAGWVLSAGAPLRDTRSGYRLQGHEGQASTWEHDPLLPRLQDTEGPLACAIAAALAQGHGVEKAINLALSRIKPQMTRSFQPGMGLRFLDRTTATLVAP